MKATLTFVTLFFAALSSVFASPLPRRDASDLLAQLTLLSSVADTFDNLVPASGGILDLDAILGVLLTVPEYYENCNSALAQTPQLSNDDDSQKVVDQYAVSSSKFSNGFNKMAANKKASKQQGSSVGGALDGVLLATGNAIKNVGNAAGNFAANLGSAVNGNSQQQNQVANANSQFQSSAKNAQGSV